MSTLEYEDIYDDMLNNMSKNNDGVDNLYNDIINQELVITDTLKRLSKVERQQNEENRTMLNSTVQNVVFRTFDTVRAVFLDLVDNRPFGEVFRPDRRIYVGIFVIFLSVCFIILYKA